MEGASRRHSLSALRSVRRLYLATLSGAFEVDGTMYLVGFYELWLKTVSLDEQVDAEPLIVSNETLNGAQHNVVYVATEDNTVYALDSVSGKVLVETNLGAPVPQRELPGLCTNNSTEVGINSTPVIDTNAGAMYLINHVPQGGVQAY